jgi:hypothetical protein
LDSTKTEIETKMDTIVSKGAQKVEEAAQKVKKSIKNNN